MMGNKNSTVNRIPMVEAEVTAGGARTAREGRRKENQCQGTERRKNSLILGWGDWCDYKIRTPKDTLGEAENLTFPKLI